MSMNNAANHEQSYNADVLEARKPQYGVDPMFVNRWSTRAFEPYTLSEEELYRILEAGQYAPSANNVQPWRFYLASTAEQKELFLSFIMPRNQVWSKNASAYILLASDTLNAEGKEHGKHAFDTGAAWQAMALQAHLMGLATRAMGGFDGAAAKEKLSMPQQLQPQIVIAIGKPGSLDQLDESFHSMNKPTPRKPLDQLIMSYEVK